jgi:hypothetical protein
MIIVPPGHIVILYQRILHIVTSRTSKYDSYRQFRTWRITKAPERPAPLNGYAETLRCVRDFAVPKKPSSQDPPMYSSNHGSAFLFKDDKNDLIRWSRLKFKTVCMAKESTCGSGKNMGRKYVLVERFMKSLEEMNLHEGVRPYELFEVHLLLPGRH